MKSLITSVLFALLVFPAAIAQNGKQFMLDYYTNTENQLQQSISGLSEAQMNFKATPESWSINQCLEHIIKTEQMIFGMIKAGLQLPSNINELGAPINTDEKIIQMVTDRSSKYKAPAELVPEGKYTSPEKAMNDLKTGRVEILALINSTPDATLRDHVSESPAGIVDAYQNFLFLAGHTARHTLQLQEVKADPAFPKS
jgi:hypothetical protein